MSNAERFVAQLLVLRRCVIQSLIVIVVIFLALIAYAGDLYHGLAMPVITHLTGGASLIATSVIAPLWVPIKFVFILSVFLAIPVIFYLVWRFIAPALYVQEKKMLRFMLCMSITLFYVGAGFAFWVVCPLLFNMVVQVLPPGVKFMPDISLYLSFIMRLLFAFGLAFEVPIIMLLLVRAGLTTRQGLTAKRPYFIVLAFVLGMLLTPPDVVSQIMLAVPLCLLFEVGLFCAKFVKRPTVTNTMQQLL